MKALAWIVPCLCLVAVGIAAQLEPAQADEAARWEYKHLLIPLERQLQLYERADMELLKPLRELGNQGWELVTAYEPPGGFTINGRASVEFWLKRRID